MTTRTDKNRIRLYGRIFLDMNIRAVTGLRIGGAPAALAIGSLDNPVIRNPLNNQPYIPGSSLRGKMRSLWEKANESEQNFPIRRSKPEVYIHAYPAILNCPVYFARQIVQILLLKSSAFCVGLFPAGDAW